MREKLLVITSHELPRGRFWTECDKKKKKNVQKRLGPGKLVERV